MKNLANFVLFQGFWFVAVAGAADGILWAGPVGVLVFLVVHLAMVQPATERVRELRYLFLAGVVGFALDSGLAAIGATAYPTSAEGWPHPVAPPWIVSLWVAFAMLPRFSLGWLRGRPALAFAFGAIGGPFSYFAGTRFGSVAVGESALLTYGALAVEYALVTPLLLHFAPSPKESSPPVAENTDPNLAV